MSYEGLKASLGFSLFLFGMCVQARSWRLGRILVSDQQGCEFVFCCSGFEKTPPAQSIFNFAILDPKGLVRPKGCKMVLRISVFHLGAVPSCSRTRASYIYIYCIWGLSLRRISFA